MGSKPTDTQVDSFVIGMYMRIKGDDRPWSAELWDAEEMHEDMIAEQAGWDFAGHEDFLSTVHDMCADLDEELHRIPEGNGGHLAELGVHE